MINLQQAASALDLPVPTVLAIVRMVESIRSFGAGSGTCAKQSECTMATELLASLEKEYDQRL